MHNYAAVAAYACTPHSLADPVDRYVQRICHVGSRTGRARHQPSVVEVMSMKLATSGALQPTPSHVQER
jgi:hypothetical protein